MKRINRLSKEDQLDLIFDLINALSLANDPKKAAALLEDLFTPYEIKNISKRLRIAKLLLEGKTHEEIINELHCSFANVAKMNSWLKETGLNLKETIKKLPKKHEKMDEVGEKYRIYRLPEALYENYINMLASDEKNRVEELIKNSELKKELFNNIQNAVNEFYKKKKLKQ